MQPEAVLIDEQAKQNGGRLSKPMSRAKATRTAFAPLRPKPLVDEKFALLHRDERVIAAITRQMDIMLALAVLVFLLPVFILLAVLITVTDTRHFLFRHRRIGRGGQPFYCLKFRTMAINSDEILADLLKRDPIAQAEWDADRKLRNDPRVTKVGRFLRMTSLDEIPQLWNVLVGDMSLVGPRPIVHDEIKRYGRYFRDYCSVRPGITGLWQVSGRNDVNYRRRVAMDVIYCRRNSTMMYMTILAKTIPAVVASRGVH